MNETVKEVNQIVGRSPSLAFLSVSQFAYVLWPVLIPLSAWALFNAEWQICVAMGIVFTLPIFFLTLNNGHSFFEKLYIPIAHHLSFQPIQPGTGFMPTRPPITPQPLVFLRSLFRQQGAKLPEDSDPIEINSDLVIPVQIELNNASVGCYLLKDQDDWSVVFAWDASGLDPSISPEDAIKANRLADMGLRTLPSKTFLTFDYQSFRSDSAEQRRLDSLIKQVDGPLEKALLWSQKKNIRNLRTQGECQVQTLTVYLQQPINRRRDQDFFDIAWDFLENIAHKISKQKSEISRSKLRSMLLQAYAEGYLRYETILRHNFSLTVKPLSAQALYEKDYLETHLRYPPTPELPQMLRLSETGLQTVIADRFTHINSYLFQGERGLQAVPKASRQFIHFPSKKQYAGVLQIGKTKAFTDPRGADLGQIQFLSGLMERSGTKDYRIVTQIGPTNKLYQQFLLERETKEATSFSTKAASTGRDIAVNSEQRMGEAVDARRALYKGKTVVSVSTGIWLYRDSPRQLTNDFGTLQDSLQATLSERCWERTFDFWCQSQPWCATPLFFKPHRKTALFQSDEAAGYAQRLKPRVLDNLGVHFLTKQFKSPLYIDLFESLSHLAVFATTRGGKSVLLADIILNFFYRNIPVVAFDFPKPTDGTSTFHDLVQTLSKLGAKAAYYDTRKECFNIIGIPNLTGMKEETIRLQQIISFHIRAILIIVLGELDDPLLIKRSTSLVTRSYKDFQRDPDIQLRYRLAQSAKRGTPDYNNVPTLWDYLDFAQRWFSDYRQSETLSDIDIRAISLILEELRSTLEGEYGNAIAQPTSFDPDVRLLIFALRELDDPNEAAVMALSAYSALLSRALSSPDCAFIIDETPILFEFDAIARIVGRLCANGLKFGCRVVLSGQTATAITQSKSGDKIMETVLTKMVGYISSQAIPSFEKIGFRHDLVKEYTTRRPDPVRLASQWLIRRGDDQIEVEYIPSELMLSLVANNPAEQAARDRIMAQFDHPLEGISAFSELYAQAMRNGISMQEIGRSLLPSNPSKLSESTKTIAA